MEHTSKMSFNNQRGEVLIAIMNHKSDFAILQNQGWYRVPVSSAPKLWPPKVLAFYQTKIFEDEAFAVNYYGVVRGIYIRQRKELFPQEPFNIKSNRRYYQVYVDSLHKLPRPIISKRWRRIVFIPTTWEKFMLAFEVNDLFDDSPLENVLWRELKKLNIPAERQWYIKIDKKHYFLDFAVFCREGSIDIETDGDTWHADPKRIPKDNERDNALTTRDWSVLRFNGVKVREELTTYCIPQITRVVNRLGGLNNEGLVSRKFYDTPSETASQLTLFDDG